MSETSGGARSTGTVTGQRDGKIVTFYSFKGGTGRTMALANIAWILAANGKRVLVADWDLESPGLHRFYHPFLDIDVSSTAGIIDLIRDYEWTAIQHEGRAAAHRSDGTGTVTSGIDVPAAGQDVQGADRIRRLIAQRANVRRYAISIDWDFPHGGHLDFLSAGRQNSDYAATLSGLDWDTFYDRLNGAEFFDALRTNMKQAYDYVLIDSRTGLSDVADICTLHLPDVLVDCFTLSTQGIEGAARIARTVQEQYPVRGIRILPVPMRVDQAEKERADAGQAFASRLFSGLPEMPEPERRKYWSAVEVPYRPFYAYEETLAVFGDIPDSPTTMLASFERITGYITGGTVTSLPPMPESLRITTRALFTRRTMPEQRRIRLDHSADDQLWAEWIGAVLEAGGIDVLKDASRTTAGGSTTSTAGEPELQVLSIVSTGAATSSAAGGSTAGGAPAAEPSYVVHVSKAGPLTSWPSAHSVSLVDLQEHEAIDRLLHLVHGPGRRSWPVVSGVAVRYPGTEPAIFQAPARNTRFTGREDDLRRLRGLLQESGTAVLLPVALQGLGGVGKTQVALEYAHRFKTDYDLAWWLDCSQPQFIDTALHDLGRRMEKELGPVAPAGASVAEVARGVLRILGSPESGLRWLIVYDNAEDIEAVHPFLPTGNGHVLITSRNRSWSADDRARALPVEVFTRAESIAHLRGRVGSISRKDADQVAEVLGDLPLAVATAGAWLAETSVSVTEYLRDLERQGPRTLSIGRLAGYPQRVAQAWDVSLNRLEERSPAAARLLEMCSLMAPDIRLDLIYSPAMAEVLAPLDPALSEPIVIGRVIQETNRLALIKHDPTARQIQMHRLVQAVVQDRMSERRIEETRRQVHQVLASARPRREVDDPETWSRYRMIWPHLGPSDAMNSESESVRQLLIDRVRYLWLRGDLEGGRELATEVEAVWQRLSTQAGASGTGDGGAPGTGASGNPSSTAALRQLYHLRFNFANILRDMARFEQSRKLDTEVLAGQRSLLGEDHPHTLMTAGGLAADLRALGEYRQAREMDKATHPAWTELYGPDHARTLTAAHNLAVSYRATGQYTEAIKLDSDTHARRLVTLKHDHPHTLGSAVAICRNFLEAGHYDEAADQMESVVKTSREALGPDDRTTLNTRVLLGVALRSTGRPGAAEPHFLDAWDGLSRRFGGDSQDALACRLSHSINLLALDDPHQAETEMRAVLAVYEQRFGALHPHALVCAVNLASALRLQYTPASAAKALTTIRAAAEGLENRLSAEHPYSLAAQMVLGVALADVDEWIEARAVEERAVERMTKKLGPHHPDTLRCRANLMLTRQQSGDRTAMTERMEIVARLTGLLGAEHPNIATLRDGRRLLRAIDPQPF